MKSIFHSKLQTCLIAAILGLVGMSLHAAEYVEDFTVPVEGSELKGLDGWKLHYGTQGNADIELAAGYSGKGARIKLNEQYRRVISHEQTFSLLEGGRGEFRMKLRIMAPNDGYTLVQVLIGFDDGVHGLAVRFDGGSRDGSGDNFIRLSREGKSWGQIVFEDIKAAKWEKEVWYEIIISDIGRSSDSEISGKVTVSKADEPQSTLVENAPISSIGGKGAFPAINLFVVGNCGTPKIFDIDDISLKPMK